jgi:MoaA/NifB/PqqE/SkfB family radical SAM enzyme
MRRTLPTLVHATADADWAGCRFLTCSVLPVRLACNLVCPFCFSRSSISALRHDRLDWEAADVEAYYALARERGATRLVITGGGEPLLRADLVVRLVERGRPFFPEIACFTNGTYLTRELAGRLRDAGLSYLCYSRHHDDDAKCRELMGPSAPALEAFFLAAAGLLVRATCVMARGYIDSPAAVERYQHTLSHFGVREFTFKHTYVAYEGSVFGSSQENHWAMENRVDLDPFASRGEAIGRLPWGPAIRRIGDFQVCYYYEPEPAWEKEHQLCRSINLLSDGSAYASLEDHRSRLFQLNAS